MSNHLGSGKYSWLVLAVAIITSPIWVPIHYISKLKRRLFK